MSIFDLIASTVDTDLATFGQVVTYSRPDSPNFDAIAPFTITAVANTGGEYTSPTAPLIGEVSLRISDIPLGPQKGDQVTPSRPEFMGRTFRVDEIFLNVAENHANLKIRWTNTT